MPHPQTYTHTHAPQPHSHSCHALMHRPRALAVVLTSFQMAGPGTHAQPGIAKKQAHMQKKGKTRSWHQHRHKIRHQHGHRAGMPARKLGWSLKGCLEGTLKPSKRSCCEVEHAPAASGAKPPPVAHLAVGDAIITAPGEVRHAWGWHEQQAKQDLKLDRPVPFTPSPYT
eukprot:516691-Pelagomonas_calceolata.AAC.6